MKGQLLPRLFLSLLLLIPLCLLGQNRGRPPMPSSAPKEAKEKAFKPKVLVYGSGVDAFAAALQAAQSGVQTLWVMDKPKVESLLTEGQAKTVNAFSDLTLGSWALFLRAMAGADRGSDSVYRAARSLINPQIAINTFEHITDTAKNLQARTKTAIIAIKKAGKGYEVTYDNKEKQKFTSVVDASDDHVLFKALDSNYLSGPEVRVKKRFDLTAQQTGEHKPFFRTSVSLTAHTGRKAYLPITAVLPDTASNIFATKGFQGSIAGETTVDGVPQLLLQGQAIGAMAAFCAFFDTTTDKIAVRLLQGELLAYGSWLLPFQDIGVLDPHAGAIQRIGLTGLLKGEYMDEKFLFLPDTTVSKDEIRDICEQLFIRSQVWFLQHEDISRLSLGQTLDFIEYLAHKGDAVRTEVEKGWTKRFKFTTTTFDRERPITRREFAVLIDAYLQPFNVKVDWEGNFMY